MRGFIHWARLVALAGILMLAGCAAGSTSGPSTPDPSPSSVPDPTPAPTATPAPTTDGQGDEYVVGTWSLVLTIPYISTPVGDVTQLRGGLASITMTMNDPRLSGKATLSFSGDLYTKVAPEWGTFHLETADGAWDGTLTGGAWDDGNGAIWSCWLIGSGGYEGSTAYLQFAHELGGRTDVQGIIYPGAPPTP